MTQRKQGLLALILALLLAAMLVPAVMAAPPVGTCPVGFDLHETMHHEHHEHHVGLKTDLNGDLSICVKELDNGLHVHVDNVIP